VDFEYLTRRYEDELTLAKKAETEAAREAHLALAHQYLVEIERLRGDRGPELQLAAG
jgi:hypothetical protein